MYAPIMKKKPASGHSAGARGLGNLEKANRIDRFCFSPQVGDPVWCAKEETKHEAGRLCSETDEKSKASGDDGYRFIAECKALHCTVTLQWPLIRKRAKG